MHEENSTVRYPTPSSLEDAVASIPFLIVSAAPAPVAFVIGTPVAWAVAATWFVGFLASAWPILQIGRDGLGSFQTRLAWTLGACLAVVLTVITFGHGS